MPPVTSSSNRALVAILLIGWAGGCSRESPKTEDSAPLPKRVVVDGVTELHYPGDVFDRAPRLALDSVPVAVLGGAKGDPEYDLTMVRRIVMLDDGRFAVLAGRDGKLFIFGPDGTPLRTIGKRGGGPGDFALPRDLSTGPGDTLLVPDAGNSRLNYLTPDGGVVKMVPALAAGPTSSPFARLPDGRVIAITTTLPAALTLGQKARIVGRVLVADIRGYDPRVVVDEVPAGDLVGVPAPLGDGQVEMVEPRFGRRLEAAVWDTLIALGTGDGYRVDAWSAEGRRIRTVKVAIAGRPVTSALMDQAIQRHLKQLEDERAAGQVFQDFEAFKRRAREHPAVDTLPPYGQFFGTETGELWVMDWRLGDREGWSATLFGKDGELLGRLTVPIPSVPRAFTRDRVVLQVEDVDGVVALEVYRIRPSHSR